MSTDNKQRDNHVIDSVFLWLIFGVILVITPPAYVILYEKILGADFTYLEYAPDALLVMLSLYCNLMNLFVDRQKRIFRALRWIFGIILFAASAGCWGLFFIIRFSMVSLDDVFLEKLYVSLFIVIVGCAIIGSLIEGISNCKKTKKEEVNG